MDSFRKTETVDPLHKWIGTYNAYRVNLVRFFKWLYYPDVPKRERPKPAVIENIHEQKRREQSIYKPSNLWTPEDDLLFLKYCPSKRDKPYIRRHSALTEKSMILKEHVLRQHPGWSARSQMHLKYLHYFGNESSQTLLEEYGLIDKGIQLD